VGLFDKYAIPVSGMNHVVSPHKHPEAACSQGVAAFCIVQSISESSKKKYFIFAIFQRKN
jgi:hypothetical protein